MKTLKLIIALAIFGIASQLSGQETGIIKGTLTDEKGKNMPFVTVALMEDSVLLNGIITDDAGDFTFKHLSPGIYNLQFSFTGYKTKKVKRIEVMANQTAYVYKTMKPSVDTLIMVEITSEKWEKSIINPDFSTVTPLKIDQIENAAVGKNDIIALIVMVTPGVQPTEDGKDIYMRGSRRGSTAYYVDGNRVIGSPEVPGASISGMEILTGGVPAEYGDCTGGIVLITTKDYKTEMRKKEMKRREREEKKSAPTAMPNNEDE